MNTEKNEIRMSQKNLIESLLKEVEIKATKIPGYPNVTQKSNKSEAPKDINKY